MRWCVCLWPLALLLEARLDVQRSQHPSLEKNGLLVGGSTCLDSNPSQDRMGECLVVTCYQAVGGSAAHFVRVATG